jgi:hypothetical protein
MTSGLFTDQVGWTGQALELPEDPATYPETASDAPETRGPLQVVADIFLGLLDLYVRLMGLDDPQRQLPDLPVAWTPYSGHYLAASRWGGERYRWWGQ